MPGLESLEYASTQGMLPSGHQARQEIIIKITGQLGIKIEGTGDLERPIGCILVLQVSLKVNLEGPPGHARV